MPIKKELRPLYPSNWKDIVVRIRQRCGDCCEFCGLSHGAWGHRDSAGKFVCAIELPLQFIDAIHDLKTGEKLFKVQLTVAHLDHDPTNNSDENLRALCCQCHNRHDGQHRARSRSRTRDAKRGQLRLFPDPEE